MDKILKKIEEIGVEKIKKIATILIMIPVILFIEIKTCNYSIDLGIIVSGAVIIFLFSLFFTKKEVDIISKILGLLLIPNIMMFVGENINANIYNVNILIIYIYAIVSFVSFILLYPLQRKIESYLSNKMDNMTDKIFK